MLLFHRDLGGEGRPPLLVLHGLLGSSRNWQTIGRLLSNDFHVCALDIRNHGESPWRDEHSYDLMVDDVLFWMDHHEIERSVFLGHSMGGKVAMRLACRHPDRVGGLIVVDIAPRAYPSTHIPEFEAMNALPLSDLTSRAEAEEKMKALVTDWALRKFLLTNLERSATGRFGWKVNVSALEDGMENLEEEPLDSDDLFGDPVLFLLGGRSPYFRAEDESGTRKHFPEARFVRIEGSGHNPHIEARDQFIDEVRKYLDVRWMMFRKP
ncbi:MAG: alpha/beta hydrolase [Verrucomicrobia bacterium]|nr:MAG: alpha/beta hydrolase [Verrucomicrobiota bacterium]